MKSAPSAILFDVDGTLVDTFHLYLESYRRALEPHLGYAPADEEFIERRPSSERRFLAEWIGAERAVTCHAEMCRHYEELHGGLCGGLYDGTSEMLRALTNAGIPLGVVTGKGRRAWEITATALDLGHFDVIVTDDDVERPKPHPEGLLAGLDALRVDAASAVYVGDSVADIEAGRRAGVRTGAALWPKTDSADREHFLAQLERQSPDWRFERPSEITRLFARWC